MDDNLKRLLQELGHAINDTLSDSDKIAEAVGEIRQAGYDIFLVLEATIGFNKREDGNGQESDATPEAAKETVVEPRHIDPATIFRSKGDKKFLKSLKITDPDLS